MSQIASEAILEDLNSKFSWGSMPPDLRIGTLAYTRYYHPAATMSPPPPLPPQLKILYETLTTILCEDLTHSRSFLSLGFD